MKNIYCVALAAMLSFWAYAQQAPDQHHEGVVQRGDQVMGFSHEKTIHHFRLTPDGGTIEALATNPSDAASREQIRTHLEHIAQMFHNGNFNAPMLIHAQTPPGVPAMKKLRKDIRYDVEGTPNGARVKVSSRNPQAIAAIHDFLKFQIQDHRTGDPINIKSTN
ncbi:MAG TPA: hypothetical protein VJR04_07170 [Terriglobales bacterium]|nr:hypothetical protein [Terriglobales bacterium]